MLNLNLVRKQWVKAVRIDVNIGIIGPPPHFMPKCAEVVFVKNAFIKNCSIKPS